MKSIPYLMIYVNKIVSFYLFPCLSYIQNIVPQYSWSITKVGVKHQSINQSIKILSFVTHCWRSFNDKDICNYSEPVLKITIFI
jgi:hypothetical protein